MTNRDIINALAFVGGSAPVLETLNVSANGIYTPSSGYDGFNQVTVEVDSEWHTVTFTGTLAAPFTFADLVRLDNADTIYGEMSIDATAIGLDTVNFPLGYIVPDTEVTTSIVFSICVIPTANVSDVNAAYINILADVENKTIRLSHANMMQQGAIVGVLQYASLMPTTTTFVYHVRPSNN